MRKGMRKHTCRICGKVFYNTSSNCVTCSDSCRAVNHRLTSHRYKAKVKLKPDAMLSLAEISKAAKEAGMTYGQYVAQTEILNR